MEALPKPDVILTHESDLDGLIAARDLGATRCGTSATAQILAEYRRRKSLDNMGLNHSHSSAADAVDGNY